MSFKCPEGFDYLKAVFSNPYSYFTHDRNKDKNGEYHYQYACLKNILNSLAALYTIPGAAHP